MKHLFSSSSMLRAASAALLVASHSLWASDSAAFDSLRTELITKYNYGGDCKICHATSMGGGTAGQPFALTLKAKGLVATDPASVSVAVEALTPADDSDADGDSDFDELTQDGDPNDASVGIGEAGVEPAEYGCVGGTIAGNTESNSGAALAAAGFMAAALLWSRRRNG
jgi:hypothetical protein